MSIRLLSTLYCLLQHKLAWTTDLGTGGHVLLRPHGSRQHRNQSHAVFRAWSEFSSSVLSCWSLSPGPHPDLCISPMMGCLCSGATGARGAMWGSLAASCASLLPLLSRESARPAAQASPPGSVDQDYGRPPHPSPLSPIHAPAQYVAASPAYGLLGVVRNLSAGGAQRVQAGCEVPKPGGASVSSV